MSRLSSTKLYRLKVIKMLERHERDLSDVLDNPVVTCHAEFAPPSWNLVEEYRAKNKKARRQLAEEHVDELQKWG